jgi:hypothetical protein
MLGAYGPARNNFYESAHKYMYKLKRKNSHMVMCASRC